VTPEQFVTRLEGVRAHGEGAWYARCPAHEDRRQSLSVGSGAAGRVLLTCFAGCEPKAIAESLGLTEADLFAERGPARERVVVSTYDYRDEGGGLLFQVVRLEPKDFRQRRPDGAGGWTWKLNGVRRVLYRLPGLCAADPDEPVFIVEGEKDVDRLSSLGLVATTNAGGAGKWRAEYGDALRGRDVVVLPDNDEPGRQHAEQVARGLQDVAVRVRVVPLPGVPPKGDVNDWLTAGGTVDELRRIVALTGQWEPKVEPVAGFASAVERLRGEREERRRIGERVLPFGVSYLDDVCRGILPTDLVVLGARPGAGKTQLAVTIAQGAAKAGRQVFFFALEAERAEIERRAKFRCLVSRLYARGQAHLVERVSYLDWLIGRCDDITGQLEDEVDAELAQRYQTLHTFYRESRRFDTDALNAALQAIRERAELVVVDHLHYVDSDDESENRAMKRIVQAIRDAALASGKPVIAVAHLRKRERGRVQLVPDLDDFHGSSDIVKVATRVVVLAPARDQPSGRRSIAPTYVAVVKDRPGGIVDNHVALAYFDVRTGSYDSTYRLGRLSFMGDAWNQLAAADLPRWARHALDASPEGGAP